jgi:hypothetical protein
VTKSKIHDALSFLWLQYSTPLSLKIQKPDGQIDYITLDKAKGLDSGEDNFEITDQQIEDINMILFVKELFSHSSQSLS